AAAIGPTPAPRPADPPGGDGPPTDRHRYRLRVGQPISRRPGAVAARGRSPSPLPTSQQTSNGTPSPGVGRPATTTASAPPAGDSVPPTVGGAGPWAANPPHGPLATRHPLHHRGAV